MSYLSNRNGKIDENLSINFISEKKSNVFLSRKKSQMSSCLEKYSFDFDLIGTPITVDVKMFRGFTCFDFNFFYEMNHLEIPNFMWREWPYHASKEQLFPKIKGAIKDIFVCLSKIIERHQKNSLDYAVWYIHHHLGMIKKELSYEQTMMKTACECIVKNCMFMNKKKFEAIE